MITVRRRYCRTLVDITVRRRSTREVFVHPLVNSSYPQLNALHFIVPKAFLGPTNPQRNNTRSSKPSPALFELISRRLCVSHRRPSSVSHLNVYTSHLNTPRCLSRVVGADRLRMEYFLLRSSFLSNTFVAVSHSLAYFTKFPSILSSAVLAPITSP